MTDDEVIEILRARIRSRAAESARLRAELTEATAQIDDLVSADDAIRAENARLRGDCHAFQIENDGLLVENKRLRAALTPSKETKAAYIGKFDIIFDDPDRDYVTVPWTTIREIMEAIMERASMTETAPAELMGYAQMALPQRLPLTSITIRERGPFPPQQSRTTKETP